MASWFEDDCDVDLTVTMTIDEQTDSEDDRRGTVSRSARTMSSIDYFLWQVFTLWYFSCIPLADEDVGR
jgi:hypothetical protein